MATLTIYGYVAGNGSVLKGTGFKVVRDTTGVYTVLFSQDQDGNDVYNDTPSVCATQVYTGDMSYGGGYLTDNAVVIAIASDRVKILTGNDKNHSDRQFTFIAVGPSNYSDIEAVPLAT